MKQDLFSVPVFIDEVDLSKIVIVDEDMQPTFRSGVHTSLRCDKKIPQETISYLSRVIAKNIDTLNIDYSRLEIVELWRNRYKETDWQEPHIHAFSQWSFIIYEEVDRSRTVFQNPYRNAVHAQMPMYKDYFVEEWFPEFKSGNIVIFPSFIEHYVVPGGVGSTISGNVFIKMWWED